MAFADLSNAPVRTTTATNPMPRAMGGGVSGLDATIAAKSGSSSGALQFPQDRAKYYTVIDIFEYSRQDLTIVGSNSPVTSGASRIFLPLPANLQETQANYYSEEPLGVFAGAATASISSSVSQGGQLFTGENLIGIGAALGADQALQASGALNSKPAGILQAMTGVAPNEFFTVLFKRPLYKTHQLTFKMSPQNFKEASTIRKIIHTLHKSAAPSLTADQMVFTFPKILRIAYMPNPGYIFKFKPSVIESFTVNYAGGGTPAFYRDSQGDLSGNNNAPESVDIVLQLKELEYWIDNNFQDTNNPYDGEMAVSPPGGGNRYATQFESFLQGFNNTNSNADPNNASGPGGATGGGVR